MSTHIRISWSALALATIALGSRGPVEAASVTINPTHDNTLIEDTAPDGSCAIGPLFVGETRVNLSRRGLVVFDVAGAIPSGSTINSAELRMTVIKAGASSQPTDVFKIHRATASWGESSGVGASECSAGHGGSGAPGDATWTHRFFPATLWTTAGGDYVATASGSTTAPTLGLTTWPTQPGMVADVQSWLDDPGNNFGWILLGNEALTRRVREFASREGNPKPALIINYTAPVITTPPEVPDGRFASPLLVDRLSADGSDLQLSWNTAHCTLNPDHNIAYGTRSTFPALPLGIYGLQGVVCDPGGSSPFAWLGSPDPAALDPESSLLWMLVIANDDATVEGPWGKNSSQERRGPGTNGSTNGCGILDKSLTNLCGQGSKSQ